MSDTDCSQIETGEHFCKTVPQLLYPLPEIEVEFEMESRDRIYENLWQFNGDVLFHLGCYNKML